MPRNNEDFYLERMGQALGFPATPSFEKPRPSIRVLEGGGKTSPIKINTDPMKFNVPGQGKVVATKEGGPSGRLVGNLGRGGLFGGGNGLYGNMFKR